MTYFLTAKSLEKGYSWKTESDVTGGNDTSRETVAPGQQVAPRHTPVITSQIVALLSDTQKLTEKVTT